MSWNQNGPYGQDPNQGGYYGNAPPPHQPYPPNQPYPPQQPPHMYPPQPNDGYAPYPPQQGGAPGFQQPPPYEAPHAGEDTPFSDYNTGNYGAGGAGGDYAEDPEVKGFDFSDKSIRRGFIRKVYAILMLQLSVSMGFIAWFLFHKPTQRFVHDNSYLLIIALVIVFVSMIVLACCGEARRQAPMNFILLGIFTLAESFMLAVCASSFKSEEVLLAVGITAAVCLGLTLFAFQTKYDFTMCGGILFVAVLILILFGFLTIFFHGRIVQLVYASLGALIFSIYLIYDTQLMMGGSHKYSISPEEYIFAALNLYVDIINIFLYILTIIGRVKN